MWDTIVSTVVDGLETGLPYTIAFLGVWIVFRTQNDFDLTVDSSFTLGGAVAAVWIVGGGNPWLALVLAMVAGSAAGLITFTVMRSLGLSLVLASIIVNIGLFSVNLHILGLPDLNFVGRATIITQWDQLLHISGTSQLTDILLMAIIAVMVFSLVARFLQTETGLALRASGLNRTMARSVGVAPSLMLLIALLIGNGLTGLAGALVTQQQQFADVSMGIGTIIFGVTSVLLGEIVVRGKGPVRGVTVVMVGALMYRLILSIAFEAGVAPDDFKGLTALTVLGAVLLNRLLSHRISRGWRTRRSQERAIPAATQGIGARLRTAVYAFFD